MKKEYRKAYKALQKMGVPVFEHWDWEDGFDISAEREGSQDWLSYWRMADEEWTFGIHPDVNQVLNENGLYAEWVNPAHARVYVG